MDYGCDNCWARGLDDIHEWENRLICGDCYDSAVTDYEDGFDTGWQHETGGLLWLGIHPQRHAQMCHMWGTILEYDSRDRYCGRYIEADAVLEAMTVWVEGELGL